MQSKLVLIGGGGHCKSIISSINKSLFSDVVIVDSPEVVGKSVDGVLIVGTDDDLPQLYADGYQNAFVAVGSVSSSQKRMRIAESLSGIGFAFPTIIDSTAVIAESAIIGNGVFIGKNAVINAGSKIEDFAIINTGVIVDHDCTIGEYVHLSPGAVLSGMVSVGKNTHVGTGCSVKQGVFIGDNTTVGMGSVVLHDIPPSCTAYGNPCKVVRSEV